ncbi:MAG: HAD family hydrolase [Desulfobacteraceae bacterium]|nr:MAG: HAD family hydrolase [Desulfobacteraceae bacterium]
MSTLRVLILDFDGVVIESNSVKTEAFASVFARFPEHADSMMAFHHANVSLTRFAKFDHLMQLIGRAGDTALRQEISREFSRKVVEKLVTVPFVPGAENFLGEVATRMPVYLASVTPEEELNLILARRNLVHWFKSIYGCPPWTKPEAIRDVLAREGVPPQSALLIGDSAGDQRAAMATGVNFVARDSGLRFEAPMPPVFPDLSEIKKHLEKLLP